MFADSTKGMEMKRHESIALTDALLLCTKFTGVELHFGLAARYRGIALCRHYGLANVQSAERACEIVTCLQALSIDCHPYGGMLPIACRLY